MTVAKLRDICLGVLFWFYDFMLEITTMGRKMVFHGGRWESAERFDELSKYMFHYPKKFKNSQKRRVGMRRNASGYQFIRRKTSLYVGSRRIFFSFFFLGIFFVFFSIFGCFFFFWLVFGFPFHGSVFGVGVLTTFGFFWPSLVLTSCF